MIKFAKFTVATRLNEATPSMTGTVTCDRTDAFDGLAGGWSCVMLILADLISLRGLMWGVNGSRHATTSGLINWRLRFSTE